MRWSTLIFAITISTSTPLHAQMLDTLRNCIRKGVAFTATLDTRKSFVSAQSARIWGFKFGAEFGGRLTIGGGWNTHTPGLKKSIYLNDSLGQPDTATSVLHLDYISYYIKYVFYKSKRWKFSVIPFQIGFGNSRYEYDFEGKTNIRSQRGVIVYETGLSGSYKIFRWFGIGADLGLRLMLRNNQALTENFNSPIYSFYTILYWSEIYKIFFPNTKLAKRL
jgi:hypothetical protein